MKRLGLSLVALGACLSSLGCDSGPPPWLNTTGGGGTSGGETTAVDAGGKAETCAPKDPAVCPDGCAWSLGVGSAADETTIFQGLDCGQNVVVAGDFNTTLDFGGGVLEDSLKLGDTNDLYVAKLGPDGQHLWSKSFGDKNNQYLGAMAVDEAGAVLLTGTYEGTIDFGAGRIKTETQAIFVAKLDAAGNPRWSRSYDSGAGEMGFWGPRALSVDAQGNVWIGGSLGGETDFGGGPLAGGDEYKHKLFVAKLDEAGEHLWSKSFGPDYGVVSQMLFDSTGNLYLSGHSYGAIDFDESPPAETPPGGDGTFIVKLDPSGKPLHTWYFPSETIQGAYQGVGFQMALDSAEDLVIAGSLYGEMDLGGGPLGDAYFAVPQMFAAKYDANGNHLWSKVYGEDVDASAGAVAIGEGDHLFVVGNVIDSLDAYGLSLPAAGSPGSNGFAAELDGDGNGLWGKRFPGDDVRPSHLALTPAGTMVFTGTFQDGADFGQGPIAGHATYSDDLFIASFPH